jgi:putative cardiolipin synthase
MSRLCVLSVLVLALAASCAPSCSCGEAPPPPDRPPVLGDVPLFSDAFQFSCSPDRGVGCDGVFAIRHPVGDLPSRVGVLGNGEDSLRARIGLLERATHSIRIQALIFRGDDTGLHIAELLKRKAKEGVDVRIIVDALSNLDVATQWMYFDLKQNGIEVEGYETLYLNWLTADLTLKDVGRPNKRFHDKMWIVDAEDLKAAGAVVGGMNIANEYFRVDTDPIMRWRDQDVLLEGAVIKDVARAFDRNYDYFKALKERLPKLFNPDNSWKLTRAVLDKVSTIRTPKWQKSTIGAAINAVLDTEAEIMMRPATVRFLQSRPRFQETYIYQAYLQLMKQAKTRIDIANAYFVPDRAMIEALKDAARRGVRVRIITNSPATNDIAPIAVISRHLHSELLSVNQELSLPADQPRLTVREWIGPEIGEGTLHAKYALFDDDIALVGSYNLDPRSARLNSETALAIKDAAVTADLRKLFEQNDLPQSRAVSLEQARKWRSPKELGEQFELLFALPLKDWM